MDAHALALTIAGPSASGIAASVGRLISDETLSPGEHLPTVRALAAELGISPATVSQAWRKLGASGLVDSRRRLGTVVRPATSLGDGRRYMLLNRGPDSTGLDLSLGTPDPALLPDLAPTLARMSNRAASGSYFRPAALPALIDLLRLDWPFVPDEITLFNGATDALEYILSSTLKYGDRVIVENPGFPPIFDLLDRYGAQFIPISLDVEGFEPEAFSRAVADLDPRFVILQPRAQNPTGHGLSRARARALAETLVNRHVVIVEDDHDGAIAHAPAVSLGEWLPDQTVLIRSFSKSHGPDLRLAAVGGARELVESAVHRRLLGAGWTSLLLQAVLLDLHTSPDAKASVENARDTYARRRQSLVDALHSRDVSAVGNDGIHVWVAVPDEREALVTLAMHGVVVSPGSAFCIEPLPTDHIRVTITHLPLADVERVADVLALVNPKGIVRR